MKLIDEDQILDPEVRKSIIKEIEDSENISRKKEHFKRYEVLKDRVKKYILENLLKELEPETVEEMQSRVCNINFYKKVVNKKARVYRTKPKRTLTENDGEQEAFEKLMDKVKMDISMKKANAYLEAFLNTDVYVRPLRDPLTNKWYYKTEPMPPHKYDVIENAEDRERALGYILSSFDNTNFASEYNGSRKQEGVVTNFRDGDQVDQTIADSPQDEGGEKQKEYVWWGTKYHFTFTSSGIVTEKSPEDLANPIAKIPIVSFAKQRDGSFWSVGGEDLIEGCILINTVLSDIFYIAKMHGTGLFYFFGKGVPKSLKVGPNQAVTVDLQEGDPTPQIGFANASPSLNEHAQLAEQYIALLLTTNDLEPGSVSGSLTAAGAASGIQELIIKSEPVGSIEDDQEIFRDMEPEVASIASRWHNLYLDKGLLREDLAKIGKVPLDPEYTIQFGAVQQFINEKEKLDVIEKRLKLKLDTMVEALQLDNPDLSEEEAMDILKERAKEALLKQQELIRGMDADKEEQDQLPNGSDETTTEDEPEQEEGSEGQDS